MHQTNTIKSLPETERPDEKFVRLGAAQLSDAELLAILLRTGTKGINSVELAAEILRRFSYAEGLTGLFHLSLAELERLPGIGKVKAIQLKCICEISKRIAGRNARKKRNVSSPASIAEYYMEMLRHEEQEMVYCMMLDVKCSILGDVCVSKGTVNYALISPRELFLKALEHRAVSIVLVHNHPSGDPSPSEEDLEVTRRVAEAGKMLGIELLDHIIIGDRTYYSMAEHAAKSNHSGV